MSATDDTARRERRNMQAVAYVKRVELIDYFGGAIAPHTEAALIGAHYDGLLAGAREEAAIKDAEIERLKYENEALIGCANSIADELAALREAVRWHNHHERGVPMPKAAKEARRRALEIEP